MRYLSWFIVLYPYLFVYNVLPFRLDVGTLLLLLGLVFVLPQSLLKEHHGKSWLLFGLFCGMVTIMTYLSGLMKDIKVSTSFLRYMKMMLAFIYLSKTESLIDPSYFKRIYIRMCQFCTWFLFFQTMIYYAFHVQLMAIIPYLTSYNVSLISFAVRSFYRPSSIFLEPTAYVNYILPALGLSILEDDDKFWIKNRLLLSIGVILSTSGNGYIALASLLGIYFIRQVFRGSKGIRNVILSSVLCGIVYPFVKRLSLFRKSIERFFSSTSTSGYSTAVTGRLIGFELLKEYSVLEIIFGRGFGNRTAGMVETGGVIYYNAITAIVAGNGILGLGFYIGIYIYYYIHLRPAYKWTLIVIFAMQFSTNTFSAYYVLLYFTLFNLCMIEHIDSKNVSVYYKSKYLR